MAISKKIITLLAITILCALQTFAQEKECLGEAYVSAPEKINTEIIFYYKIEIPTEAEHIADFKPDFGQLTIKKGLSKGTKISSVTMNGTSTTTTKSTTYKWGLSADKAGVYTIPAFNIYNKEGNQYYAVPETTIAVGQNTKEPISTINHQSIPNAKDLFLEWQVDKSNVKVGETVNCSLMLYSTPDIMWIEEYIVSIPKNIYTTRPTNENITLKDTLLNDIKYHYGDLGSFEIAILAPGKAELPQITLGLTVMTPSHFGHEEYRTVETLPFTINVDDSKLLQDFPNVDIENNGTIICYDVSGSMGLRDGTSTRYDLERTINKQLMRQVQGNIKYMAFAGGKECDLCDDMSSYLSDSLKQQKDGTSIVDAMLYSIATTKKCKDIVVVTDGTDNYSHVSLETAFDILGSYAIRPHIVYVNSLSDSVYYEYKASEFSEDTLVEVANTKMSDTEIGSLRHQLQAHGGDLYLVKTENDIKAVTQRLAQSLKTTSNREAPKPKDNTNAHNFILSKIKEDF